MIPNSMLPEVVLAGRGVLNQLFPCPCCEEMFVAGNGVLYDVVIHNGKEIHLTPLLFCSLECVLMWIPAPYCGNS